MAAAKLFCDLPQSESDIVVEHRDRLMRFGLEYLEAALAPQGRVVIVDDADRSDDIVRDLHEAMVSLCARPYGKRGAKNRASHVLLGHGLSNGNKICY